MRKVLVVPAVAAALAAGAGAGADAAAETEPLSSVETGGDVLGSTEGSDWQASADGNDTLSTDANDTLSTDANDTLRPSGGFDKLNPGG